MKRFSASKTSLFLMELIIVVLIFALSSAICMRTFAESKLASELASDLSNALIKVESAAECWRGTGGDAAKTAELLSLSSSGSACFVSYDKQWQPCSEGEAAYALTLESGGGAAHIEATRLADGKLLYSLDVKLKVPIQTRPTADLLGAFSPLSFDGRQPACTSRDKNPSKTSRCEVLCSFDRTVFCQGKEGFADNTLCIIKESDAALAENSLSKPGSYRYLQLKLPGGAAQ